MREINPKKTAEIDAQCKGKRVWQVPAFEVSTFRVLVEHVARLAFANPDELLFFRGQEKDFQSKAGGSTLYPAIYRGDQLLSRELAHRFDVLDQAARLLVERFKDQRSALRLFLCSWTSTPCARTFCTCRWMFALARDELHAAHGRFAPAGRCLHSCR